MSKPRIENSFDIDGEVIFVDKPNFISPTFSIRTVIVAIYKGRYLQEIPFIFVNKNMSLLDGIEVQDHVVINFQLGGRYNENKDEWYPSIEARSIQRV